MNYLDFELPIKELEDQLADCKVIGEKSDVDVSETYEQIELKLKKTKQDIYSNLSPWQRVQMSRHPDRPYTLDYTLRSSWSARTISSGGPRSSMS